jgi:glycosyltransferase involved in cell wall biosynthesis
LHLESVCTKFIEKSGRSQHRPSIAAVLITKNEARNIGRCLRSIGSHVDRIVIADTGSTDGTLDAAEAEGIPFETRHIEFRDFSQARNDAMDGVGEDWIFWIDADEELVGGEMFRLLSQSQFFNAFLFHQIHLTVDGPRNNDCHPRLFRNRIGNDGGQRIQFRGVIHESPEDTYGPEWNAEILPNVAWDPPPFAGEKSIAIVHYGYLLENRRHRKVVDRNMPLLRRAMIEEPGRTLNWVHAVRDLFQIAKWRVVRCGAVVEGDRFHRALINAARIGDFYFSEPTDPCHAAADAWVQPALNLLANLGLPSDHGVPFQAAVGLVIGRPELPDTGNMERMRGIHRWFSGRIAFEWHMRRGIALSLGLKATKPDLQMRKPDPAEVASLLFPDEPESPATSAPKVADAAAVKV